LSNFKTPIIRDDKWLKHVRQNMQCCISGQPYPDPAHIRTGGDGGMGLKPSDNLILPLNHGLHSQQHNIGEAPFYRMYLPKMNDLSLMFFVRSGAKELYRMFKDGTLPDDFFMR
jgi:hypothetical protein